MRLFSLDSQSTNQDDKEFSLGLREFISSLDFHFAEFIADLDKSSNSNLTDTNHAAKNKESVKNVECTANIDSTANRSKHITLLAAWVSQALAEGHVCIDLSRQPYWLTQFAKNISFKLPDRSQWLELIQSSVVFKENGPLVVEGERIYLSRYWHYERNVLDKILELIDDSSKQLPATPLVQSQLDFWFGKSDPQQIDWQKTAAAVAIKQQFSVITGGPGTGKTTTVTKLLAALIGMDTPRASNNPGNDQKKGEWKAKRKVIKLVAPTGKAAARLVESIGQAKARLSKQYPDQQQVIDQIPEQASTLHRLLGKTNQGIRHHENNPLYGDVLIVDEASMIDLPMMSALMSALPKSVKLILLGDRDQLASVEAGAVLGDICQSGEELGYSKSQIDWLSELLDVERQHFLEKTQSKIQDCICQLKVSYRFKDDSGIGQLARFANLGDQKSFLSLRANPSADIRFFSLPNKSHNATESVNNHLGFLSAKYQQYFNQVEAILSPQELHSCFLNFQILTSMRSGKYGVDALNNLVEQYWLKLQQQQGRDIDEVPLWYPGKPVMVTSNDYNLSLFNGDIGICLPDRSNMDKANQSIAGHSKSSLETLGENLGYRVYFLAADGEVRDFKPARLPAHDTVFAMTIHKSQGSEFNHVALVLPYSEQGLNNRELLYTGITRAKKELSLFAEDSVYQTMIQSPTRRVAGLGKKLWNPEQVESGAEAGSDNPKSNSVEKKNSAEKDLNSQNQSHNGGEQLNFFD